ncbi:MAG: hypothetical protein RLY31_3252 [Bacteroidota bacterium]
MKNYLLPAILLVHSLWPASGHAQCPPPGFEQPGNNCGQAPILCDNLDGYCATINNSNSPQPFPGCSGQWILNNDEWFAFFAGTTSITVQIVPSNCNGNNPGLQGGIYAGCGPPWTVMDVQCPCTTNPFILTSNNFVVGQIYYIVLDGCAGNLCDYSVNVLNGSTVPFPPDNPGPISGPTTVCQGASASYSIAPPSGATVYNWTMNPSLGTVNGTSNSVSVSWGNTAGTAELCVGVANFCDTNNVLSCTTITVVPLPTATLSGGGTICPGQTNSVPLTVTFTGEAPWEFAYTLDGVPQPPIQTSDNPYTLNVTQPGTVALQNVSSVTGGCQGTASGSAQVTEIKLEPTSDVTNATCNLPNGQIDVDPMGGTAPYQFEWSDGSTSEDLADVPPGSYTLTLTDDTGCSKVFEYTVGNEPNEPSVTSFSNPSLCGEENGSIGISVSGGTPAYSYLWSNGSTNQNLIDVAAGTYTVTVTGADGCTTTSSVTLANDNPPISVNGSVAPNTSCLGGNGQIGVTVSPADPPVGGSYSFEWSNGETTIPLVNLTPGSYSVTVSGGGECTQVATFTVNDEPDNPAAQLNSITAPTCDLSNGAISVSATGATAPYSFDWSNGAAGATLQDLPAGSYTVTVTAANGCTNTATFQIGNSNPPISISADIVANTTCIGGNGSITTSVSPGLPPVGTSYGYQWSNGANSPQLTGLAPGTYTLTVTTDGSCSQVASFTVPDEPDLPQLSATVTPATCGLDNGAVQLSVSGSSSPYSFAWSNNQTTPDLTGLLAGNYTVTVTGANGCSNTLTATVPDNPVNFSLNSSVDPNTSCDPAAPTGNVSVSVSPSGNYTYQWSTGNTGSSLSNVPNGSYSVTVSAGGNCTQTLSVNVPAQPFVPLLAPNSTPATCGESNGSAVVIVSGGMSPFTYQWSTGSNQLGINNVSPGNYSVTVTGANNCSTTLTVSVGNNNPPVNIFGDVAGNTSCLAADGSIDLTLQPSGNYSFSWSNGSTSEDLTNLAPGTYTVTATAGLSCTQTASFTVPDQTQLPGLSATPTPSVCSNPDGAVTLSIVGGSPPFDILWSNGATTQNLNNLLPGTYGVTVTTATGCSNSAVATVTSNNSNISLSGQTFPNSSCTSPNGQVILSVQPPAPPQGGNYTFSWSDGSNQQDITDASPGTYAVTVSVGPSCTQTATFEVTNAAIPPQLSSSVTAATCNQANGSVDLSVEQGTSPFLYFWSNGALSPNLSGLVPGQYSVTVTDANNCTATTNVNVVNNNPTLNIIGTPTANTSCNTPNGAVSLSVSPPGTYTYAWSNGASTTNLSDLPAGTYSVTVSAGGNCTATAPFVVSNQTSPPQVSASTVAAICGDSNGSVDLSVDGPSTPFSFAWSNGATSEDLSGLAPGNYTVTVTDANDCTTVETINVANNSASFSLSGTSSDMTSCLLPNGQVDLTISPPGNYTILWSTGDTGEDLDSLSAGAYAVTVSDGGSCEASASFQVEDLTTYPVASATVTGELCGLSDGAVNLSVSDGTAPYVFDWSNGAQSEDIEQIQAGSYEVTVSDAQGCSTVAVANVPANSISFTVNGTPTGNTSCASPNGAVDVSVVPTGAYTYQWSTGAATEDLGGLGGGSYTVTVSAGGNCTVSNSFAVLSTTADPVVSLGITDATCGQNNGAVDVSVSGGVPPFSFAWSNNATTEDLAGLPAGPLQLVVTGANGCEATTTATVADQPVSFALSLNPVGNTSCSQPNGSIDLSVSPPATYSFAWSNGAVTEDVGQLPAGPYSVTVTYGLTCTASSSGTVNNNANAPDLSADGIQPTVCGNEEGAVSLNITGGSPPYLINWANGSSDLSLSGLSAGNYPVTVTDVLGCVATAAFTVPDDTIPLALSTVITPNSLCGDSNGAIDLSVVPAGNYTFDWSNGANGEDQTQLSAGTYQVTVSQGLTCSVSGSFTVPENAPVVLIDATVQAVACFGDSTGSILLSLSGGVPPLSFDWAPDLVTTDQLPAGSYALTVTDQSGCTSSTVFDITQPSAPLQLSCLQTGSVSLPGATDGSAAFTLSGGSPPYSVVTSNGVTLTDVGAGTYPLTGLGEGSYAVTVTDANGCPSDCIFLVGLVDCLTAVGTLQPLNTERCGPGCLQAFYDPTGAYLDPDDALQFVLHTGTASQIAGEILRNDSPDFCFDSVLMTYETTYFITAVAGDTDGQGDVILGDDCTVSSTGVPIVFHEKPAAAIAPPLPITCLDSSVQLVAGPAPAGSAYQWQSTVAGSIDGNPSDPAVTATAAGVFSVEVTAPNGCRDTAFATVSDIRPDLALELQANPGEILDCIISEIILTAQVSGPAGLVLSWDRDGQGLGSGTTLVASAAGNYQLTATDPPSGCVVTATIDIDDNASFPPLFADPAPVLNCRDSVAALSGSSTIGGVALSWLAISGTDTTLMGTGGTFDATVPGTYYLQGVATNGCTNLIPVVVMADRTAPNVDAGPDRQLNCLQSPVTLQGSADPNTTVAWATADGNLGPNPFDLAVVVGTPGMYVLTATDTYNHCTARDTAFVSQLDKTPQGTVLTRLPTCFGDRDGAILVETDPANGPYRFALDGRDQGAVPVFEPLSAGTYTVRVTDADGCVWETEVHLPDPAELVADLGGDLLAELGETVTLNLQVNVPVAQLDTILWQPDTLLPCPYMPCLSQSFVALQQTRVAVIAVDTNGCAAQDVMTLLVRKDRSVFVPNAFSPDGDGVNDIFQLYAGRDVLRIKSFLVFDRWGETVLQLTDFAPNDPDFGWDGSYRGRPLNPAVFTWFAVVTFVDGQDQLFRGDVSLVR